MKNFSISLFAFHLCQSFNNALDEVDDEASILWENLAKLGDEVFPFTELKDLRSHLQCYTENIYKPAKKEREKYKLTYRDDIDWGSIPTAEGFQIHGNLHAFRLHDTYAADLTLSLDPTQEINIPQLQVFKPKSLLPTIIQANLGQTLWLYAEVDLTESECEELAKKCANALLAETALNPKLESKGNLFGSLLFEFKLIASSDSDRLNQQYHLLVLLNNQLSSSIDRLGEGYDWLLTLLCCYHKIHFISLEADTSYQQARDLYSQLKGILDKFPDCMKNNDRKIRLEKLKQTLIQLPENMVKYSQCLSDIKTYCTSLDTNIKNYKSCLEKLKELGDIPQYWQEFIQQSGDRDLRQIQTHLNYLSPTQATLQQSIDTIRGIVEIEQAEIDRFSEGAAQNRQQRLELLVTVVSTGLAVSRISSQVANEPAITILSQWFPGYFSPNPQPTSPDYLFSSFSPVAFHLFLGILVAIPFGAIVWSLQTNLIGKMVRVLKKS
ncbi:hypothetical protein [Limnoraphis robusta]|uniref:Uncharacterized protein n=1 Tax=Limnoraphis robusta CCNP1315 TaxID=3110306 RepID=A0ABU5TRA8_9CYAN|nr:hypothetical protein [Limnoraphis robusta]MEA5517415.1 hypothetical protein [Limnoraphis robusta CCNP1315]MEA5545997.1 hypothetical protein [Limnoraphis robusta CCNP1324]